MSSGLKTGIAFRSIAPGLLVPEIEEREAAVFAGYAWREWVEIDRKDRVDAVAHYRLHHLIERHSSDASYLDSKRRMERSKHTPSTRLR